VGRPAGDDVKLPRLLYVGQVPVAASHAGAALLYRLLYKYPPERLMILESSLGHTLPDQRLPAIVYKVLRAGRARLLHTRFAEWYSSWLMLAAGQRARQIKALLGNFHPEAVLTVAHGSLWATAAHFAAERKLPLHLICHDDLARTSLIPRRLRPWLDQKFGRVYRQAASRLCVSQFMCDSYLERYGAKGMALYPSRAPDCPRFDAPPERISRNDHPITIAFGGAINSPGYVRALNTLATALEVAGGRLLIFGPLTASAAKENGLARHNIIMCGFVSSSDLIVRFREEVDALFVPMSFDPRERPNMEIAFPSKLTDYTSVGLPILIYGPPYCSAARWAKENRGIAELVETEDGDALLQAIERLAVDIPHRITLGEISLKVGRDMFAHDVSFNKFCQALLFK
jgi:hypothetical protein